MKIATELVWATSDGQLVKDGDEAAAVLVARAGQQLPDAQVEKYGKGADKFFKDAVFDGDGKVVPPETGKIKKRDPEPTHRDPK